MEDMQEQIQRLENKVQLLIKEFSGAQKEIQRLQKENMQLTEQIQLQANQADQLHQKYDARNLSALNTGDKTKQDLEKRINIYLKDIDKCLAMLHS